MTEREQGRTIATICAICLRPAVRPTLDVIPGDGGGPSYEGSGWLGAGSCCQVDRHSALAGEKECLARGEIDSRPERRRRLPE